MTEVNDEKPLTPRDSSDCGTVTTDRILSSAAHLFREKGFAATSTRELSEHLGIRKASLYHHIRGKEDLLYEICVQSLHSITIAVESARDNAASSKRLQSMIEAHLTTSLNDRDMQTTMLIELRSLSPERRSEVTARRTAYKTIIQNVISDDQKSGRIRNDLQPRYLTLALLNMLNWTIFWFDPQGERTASEIATMLSSVFLDGAVPREP